MFNTQNSFEQEISFSLIKPYHIKFYLKRDDLIHQYVSGNKSRKLEGHIEKYKEGNFNGIVTFGGAFSNHLLATASIGNYLGITTKGIVRGDELNSNSNIILSKCHEMGMILEFVSRDLYRKKDFLYNKLENNNWYVIEEGGYGKSGTTGFLNFIKEIKFKYDHIFVASGTGTTLAGITNYANLLIPTPKVHGICVLKGNNMLNASVEKLVHSNVHYFIHYDYHYGGYGIRNDYLQQLKLDFLKETQVKLDDIYTIKCLAGIIELIRSGEIKEGESLLMVHTGGIWP